MSLPAEKESEQVLEAIGKVELVHLIADRLRNVTTTDQVFVKLLDILMELRYREHRRVGRPTNKELKARSEKLNEIDQLVKQIEQENKDGRVNTQRH